MTKATATRTARTSTKAATPAAPVNALAAAVSTATVVDSMPSAVRRGRPRIDNPLFPLAERSLAEGSPVQITIPATEVKSATNAVLRAAKALSTDERPVSGLSTHTVNGDSATFTLHVRPTNVRAAKPATVTTEGESVTVTQN